MRVDPRVSEVRRIVLDMFEELGAPPECLFDMDEKTMIDRGRCLARTYRAEQLMAMWLIEVGLVQFYNSAGEMLATINLLERRVPQRIAA